VFKEITKKMLQINDSKAKIVIVTGAENPSGLGIVQYFLRQDATVIVPSARLHEITRLKTGTSNINKGKLITQLIQMPDYDRGFDIAEAIVERFGKIDIGVALFNGIASHKPLTEVHISDWQNMIDHELTSFFLSARLVLNSMKSNNEGVYINICDTGFTDRENFSPLNTIAANTKMEMSKIFAEEAQKYNVSYYHLCLKSANIIIENERINKDEHIMKHEMLAKQIMQLCQGKIESSDELFQSFTEHTLH
jgi:NADP-dependent 3-hydroxy acid dehydrogenase YdfG